MKAHIFNLTRKSFCYRKCWSLGNRSGENGVEITNFSSLICKLSVSAICFCFMWRATPLHFSWWFLVCVNYKFNIQMDPCIIVSTIGCLSKYFKMSASSSHVCQCVSLKYMACMFERPLTDICTATNIQ